MFVLLSNVFGNNAFADTSSSSLAFGTRFGIGITSGSLNTSVSVAKKLSEGQTVNSSLVIEAQGVVGIYSNYEHGIFAGVRFNKPGTPLRLEMGVGKVEGHRSNCDIILLGCIFADEDSDTYSVAYSGYQYRTLIHYHYTKTMATYLDVHYLDSRHITGLHVAKFDYSFGFGLGISYSDF